MTTRTSELLAQRDALRAYATKADLSNDEFADTMKRLAGLNAELDPILFPLPACIDNATTYELFASDVRSGNDLDTFFTTYAHCSRATQATILEGIRHHRRLVRAELELRHELLNPVSDRKPVAYRLGDA